MTQYIDKTFDERGPLAGVLPDYETRDEQVRMAEAIDSAVSDSEKLVVEAGTGVGKSFAYLVPVAHHALKEELIAVISTNTISLQEQIIEKDIPFLEKALGTDFKAVLVKGRHNYLCLRRLKRSGFKQKDLFSGGKESGDFARIVAWSYETADGSLYDLDEIPSAKVWDMVSSNTENCMGKKCPYFKKCFFQKAREKIADSRLLVVNHHLFFSNLPLRKEQKSVLPEWDILVFDEAHSIEGVATDHLGAKITSGTLKYRMDLLFNPGKQKGFLCSLGSHESMEWVETVRKEADLFFKDIRAYFESRKPVREADTLRIKRPGFIDNRLSGALTGLSDSLIKTKREAKNKEDELEISASVTKINAMKTSIEIILNQDMEDYVYWIEASETRSERVSLNAAPINVGSILRDTLFSEYVPTVFVSATLSADNESFGYFKSRVGLDGTRELMLGSPFDYENQMSVYIPKNMPSPSKVRDYAAAVTEKIKKYVGKTNGSAFILFTSYAFMNMVYKELEDFLIEKRYNVFKQGDGIGRSKMLAGFREKEGSLLFGVDSFWQGIDVRGRSLSNVIITKLPFSVPDFPVTEARIEDIQRKGGDAFLEYSLPEAILKFKQGFGRLIRSGRDTGMVAVLDSRIVKKHYGRLFLRAIPKCKIILEK